MAELRQKIVLGDGLAGLASLAPGSVRLILSDLPSGETRATFDRPPPLPAFWSAVWRALADDGAAVIMASRIQFASELITSQPRAFRYDLVWHKSIAGGAMNVNHRPLRAHEFILVFSRKMGIYNAQMREGCAPVNCNPKVGSSSENYGASVGVEYRQRRMGSTSRYPWSVLPFRSVGTRDASRRHPQQKPIELLRWCIRTYSNLGDLVVDPYAGSGSTGDAAELEHRRFLGWDTDPRFGSQTREAASE